MTGGEARLLPVQTRVTLRDRDLPRRHSAGPVRRRPHTSGTMQWVRGSRASVIGREVRAKVVWVGGGRCQLIGCRYGCLNASERSSLLGCLTIATLLAWHDHGSLNSMK